MNTLDRILEVAVHAARIQAKVAARKADRLITATTLKVVAAGLGIAALTVLFVAIYTALATVIHPAAALAIVAIILALLSAVVLLTSMAVGRRL